MNFVKIITNAIVATLDFCIGGMIGAFVPMVFDQISAWQTVVICGAIALAPDIDVVSHFIKKSSRQNKNHHYSISHCPLVVVPIGFLIGYLVGGLMWAVVTALTLAAHYIHDMCSALGGLMVLWPFDKRIINIKGQRFPMGQAPLDVWMNEAGPDFHNIWIRDYWLRPSSLSIWEITIALTISWITFTVTTIAWPIIIVAMGGFVVMVCIQNCRLERL